MIPQPFHELMTALLRQFDLPTKQVTPAQENYTLHFTGQPDVHIVSQINSRYIDVMSEVARLNNVKALEPLLTLHDMNGCGRTEPPVTATLHRQSGAVIVWGRQLRLEATLADLTALLQEVRQQGWRIRQELDKPDTAARPRNATAARIMQRRHVKTT